MPYPIRTAINSRTAAMAAFATAALVLAVEPVLWLTGTWRDPAYGSDGLAIFLVCAALFAWSASSSKTAQPARRPLAIGLLAASALVRLAGQLAAVHTVSALTLVLDIYGIGLLAGLNQRARALSPGWLAVAFAFSLPLERLVQRALRFGLQQLSARRRLPRPQGVARQCELRRHKHRAGWSCCAC